MDDRYEAFLMADPVFYDVAHAEGSAPGFRTADRPLPDGWHRTEQDDWLVFSHDRDVPLPEQGWKIHVSAACDSGVDNAERILDAVWDYCLERTIEFKFLRSPAALLARVSKYAPRGYSGKLVTIYPSDLGACETILRELGQILEGEPSSYILSDLRWGEGPLYVRYGAFRNRYTVDDRGEVVAAITGPDGTPVPDRRGPVFAVPSWVTVPEFLEPHLAARSAVRVDTMPYAVERVLHFSNGGGIYAGQDRHTGEKVVLKEARPHSGLDAYRHDAVRRLEHEHAMLRQLAGIPGIPAVHDLFWLGEHRFLAMEHVEGTVLSRAIVARYPLIDPTADRDEYARFTRWAVGIYHQVEATIQAMHERGVVYGDLHLFNVMVRDGERDDPGDSSVTLLDFEVAAPVAEATRPGLGNQGFAPPRAATGVDIDRYGLACLRLALFLPMTNLLWLHRPKAHEYAAIINRHFPVPDGYLEPALEVIAPGAAPEPPWIPPAKLRSGPRTSPEATPAPTPSAAAPSAPIPSAAIPSAATPPAATPPAAALAAQWPRLRDDLARAIRASATPHRDDRLFPGDVEQFVTGGLGLAYGAAGVIYALDATGAGRFAELEGWLLRRAIVPRGGTRPGLYDGLHGVAFVLDRLGYRQPALDTVDICLKEDWQSLGLDLAGGLAGVGLNLLHLAGRTGEPALRQAGYRAVELVAERLGSGPVPDEPAISGPEQGHAGLLRGAAGPALLMLRAYDDTGDTAYLDQAARALREDLRRCVFRENGTLEVAEGWRTMPYLDVGSVGIGLVLDQYLARRHDERFAEASRGVNAAAQAEMYILPGLFSGRAGILLYLAGTSADPATDPAVARQVRGLAWHALPYGGGVAFPGTGLLRLSMDLATGTAGVLLALGAALHDAPVHAPLLAPAGAAKTPAPVGAG